MKKETREEEINKYLKKKEDRQELFTIIKLCFCIFSMLIGFVVSILCIIYRFQNPHLTETERLLYCISEYWWAYLMMIVSYVILKIRD